MSFIKDLKIENLGYEIKSSNGFWLENLSKVNIFIGANNTGKSRFMRALFYQNNDHTLKFVVNDPKFNKFSIQIDEIKKLISEKSTPMSSQAYSNAKNNIILTLQDIEYFEEGKTPFGDLIKLYSQCQASNLTNYGAMCADIFNEFFSEITIDDNLFKYNFYRIYIPSLRGLIPCIQNESQFEDSNKDLYAERIKKDYFSNESLILTDVSDFLNGEHNQITKRLSKKEILENPHRFSKHSIISGLQFYDYVKNYLLGDLEQREIIREYEKYLSKTFFNNNDVALIPKVQDDVLTIKIGDEEERPIYDYGEGIQSIILITLPLFLYLDKSTEENTNILVFIEEPEVGIHPKLQRILIETLLDKRFDKYQFFLTTHSNHFIDQTLIDNDISVYLFNKEFDEENVKPKFQVYKINNEFTDVMANLGAMPSSTLMSNCTIMVEGTTDRDHFKLYLELYQKQFPGDKIAFKEGIHYSFLLAGGDEYINTIKSLNNYQKEKLFFICDYDNEQKNQKRIEFLKEYDFNNYHILNVTEVENLVSKDVVIKTLENTYDLDDLEMNKNFTQEEYSMSENFYNFIVDEIFDGKTPERFANKKGDLKEPLCRNEIGYIKNFEDLTKDAKEVSEIIYNFIRKNN